MDIVYTENSHIATAVCTYAQLWFVCLVVDLHGHGFNVFLRWIVSRMQHMTHSVKF